MIELKDKILKGSGANMETLLQGAPLGNKQEALSALVLDSTNPLRKRYWMPF